MNRCKSFFTIPIALLGIVLSLCVFALPAYAADGDVDDNPPGLFEMGFNEDTLEDNDLVIPKGPNRGKLDPRANILGCQEPDVFLTATDPDHACGVWSAQDPDTNRTSSWPPMGVGPDWGDLFTGVMNVNEPGADPLYYFVVPEFTDLIGLAVEDFIDYGALAAVFVGDHISASSAVDDTTMVSDGSDANNDAIVTYAWGTDSVPSKDDITNAYCYATTKLDIGSPDEDLLIYCGVERLSNDGSSHVDIELNKNYVGLDEEPPCDKDVCYFVGERTEGDLLVSLDFSNGGDFGSMSVRKWNSSAKVWSDPVVDLEKEGCNDEIVNGLTIPAGAACAFNNNANINGGAWPNFIKDVTPIDTDAGFTDGELPRNAFSEFGLNVTDILGQTQCISYVQIKTRTSHSFTSQLKDFAVRPFPICSSEIRTEIHSGANHQQDLQGLAVKVGTSIHDFAEVRTTGPGILQDPSGWVDFYLYDNLTCEGAAISESLATPLDGGTPNDNLATAETGEFFNLGAGEYSFHAVFVSDNAGFPSSELGELDCEPITIEKWPAKIETQIHLDPDVGAPPFTDVQGTRVPVTTAIHDHAYVSELNDNLSAPVPTGNVTFNLYDDKVCSGEILGTISEPYAYGGINWPQFDRPLVNAEAMTASFVPPVGEFGIKATYAGDANYLSAIDSACEPLDVFKLTPNILTKVKVHDLAEVSPGRIGDPQPTGTVTFKTYRSNNCSGTAVDTVTRPLSPSGDAAQLAASEQLLEIGADVVSYIADYSGNDIYEARVHKCELVEFSVLP